MGNKFWKNQSNSEFSGLWLSPSDGMITTDSGNPSFPQSHCHFPSHKDSDISLLSKHCELFDLSSDLTLGKKEVMVRNDESEVQQVRYIWTPVILYTLSYFTSFKLNEHKSPCRNRNISTQNDLYFCYTLCFCKRARNGYDWALFILFVYNPWHH